MADSTDMASSSGNKKVRGVTMMRRLTQVSNTGEKITLQFNQRTWKCYGVDAKTFKSYVGLLARNYCSILKDEWKDIDEEVKKKIWKDIQSYFIIPVIDRDPKKDPLRKFWMQRAGELWRGFKAQLTREYITKPKEGRKPPYERYTYITKDVWEKFLASRDTSEFKEKSQKGRENVAKNVHPHILSRGGYDLLTEKMMNEKRKATGPNDPSPSPPKRHAKWKAARQKKSGEYTSEATRVVAVKIDSLVEETEKGTFVPNGRDDILTNALGTDEHGGRVRGEGQGATISNYFGRSSRSTQNINVTEQLSQLEAKLKADLQEKLVAERADFQEKLAAERAGFEEKLATQHLLMQQTMMETLKSIGFSQTPPETKKVVEECSPKVVVNGSAKGSCSVAPGNIKDESDSDIDSVQQLLCMVVKRKTYFPVRLEHDACVKHFKMSPKYMIDLLVGDNWLDLSILQVWCTYMHRLSIETNNSNLYAFLDPPKLNFTTKSLAVHKEIKQYLQSSLRDLKKECFLAPYLSSGHWQLIIICPKDNIIVCLCSLHTQINSTMKEIVTTASMVHQEALGNRRKHPTWIYPKTRLQPNGNDCGYYVMKFMMDIVSASITKCWMEVFNDPSKLTEEELYDLRDRWATCFLNLYNTEA